MHNITDSVSNSIRSALLPNDLTRVVLEWDSSPQMITVSYTIIIDGVAIPPDRISVLSSTRLVISGLEANRMYTASVNRIVHSESNCTSSDQTNITFEIREESEL